MGDCIFCKIVNGEIPCYKVYEDKDFLAFLSNNPVNYGHVLLIPKIHSETFVETTDKVLEKMLPVAKKVTKAIIKATNAEGANISINNGAVAGQVLFHLHIHIIPRFKTDNFSDWPTKKYSKGEEKILKEKIKKFI